MYYNQLWDTWSINKVSCKTKLATNPNLCFQFGSSERTCEIEIWVHVFQYRVLLGKIGKLEKQAKKETNLNLGRVWSQVKISLILSEQLKCKLCLNSLQSFHTLLLDSKWEGLEREKRRILSTLPVICTCRWHISYGLSEMGHRCWWLNPSIDAEECIEVDVDT